MTYSVQDAYEQPINQPIFARFFKFKMRRSSIKNNEGINYVISMFDSNI